MTVHYTQPYLLNPQHKVTVHLVGLGGTGSRVLQGLASLNEALVSMGHPGLHVYAWDHDTVSAANVGRQMFSPADIGQNKAITLISRVNRFFGYDWEAYPQAFDNNFGANLLITCIDSAAGRVAIGNMPKISQGEPHRRYIYWMDFGNGKKTGQVVLGSINNPVMMKMQPKSEHETAATIPTVVELFDLTQVSDEDSGPSCSLAEAIRKQDLFINPTLANLGCNLLWKLFREGRISHHGCYLNLNTMIVSPIKIQNNDRQLPAATTGKRNRKNENLPKGLLQGKGAGKKARTATT